jgi:ribonuclease HI
MIWSVYTGGSGSHREQEWAASSDERPLAVGVTVSEKRSRITCYFDGSCPGNQFGRKGPMKAAYVIGDLSFVHDVPDLRTPNGPMRTNNIAEYYGLIFLLRHLRDLDRQAPGSGAFLVCGDSQLVIRQMTGRYGVHKDHLRALNLEARDLAAHLDVKFREVPREQNKAGFLLK